MKDIKKEILSQLGKDSLLRFVNAEHPQHCSLKYYIDEVNRPHVGFSNEVICLKDYFDYFQVNIIRFKDGTAILLDESTILVCGPGRTKIYRPGGSTTIDDTAKLPYFG